MRPRQAEGGAPATLAHQPQWQTQSRISTGRYTNHPVGTLINSRIPNALRAAEPTPLNFDVAPQPGVSTRTYAAGGRGGQTQASGSRLSPQSISHLAYYQSRIERNPHGLDPVEKAAFPKRR